MKLRDWEGCLKHLGESLLHIKDVYKANVKAEIDHNGHDRIIRVKVYDSKGNLFKSYSEPVPKESGEESKDLTIEVIDRLVETLKKEVFS